MKKILLVFTFFFSIIGLSQPITVNTSAYSIPKLVKDILVNKSCIPVTNITWRTGTNFGSSNGIGYFENTNPSFPLQNGVILSTGDVANEPGPNTTQLNDGNAAWTGDADLEATLLAAGITMNSTNATVLEFDFVPFSSNFNFQFLFASEEYGNFQCQFSDAFAFLLTNTSTGITTNLAVVPNTMMPISVVTIRDFLYNSSCPSVNSNFFGGFNGGSKAASSATNFNGQTVIMNASSSSLIPNTTYHIKLVIADRKDNQSDSAIFLGANSFNIGQDVLGTDLAVANNTALCEGENYTITSGLNPLEYSFAWTFNGNPVGGNTPNLTIDKPGVYGLTYTIISSSCQVTTDFINIEYYTPILTPDPVDLYKCNSGQPSYNFDLSYNTPIVNSAGTQISYHETLADAKSNTNSLPNIYTVATSSLPAPIWIRILNTATNCVTTKKFQLALTPPPLANNPGNITLCETTLGSNVADFNLNLQTNAVLGSQPSSIYDVSYYSDAVDANAGTNPIDTAVSFISGNTTLFVRIQNHTDSSCYSVTSFDLLVIPRPALDTIQNQFVCLNYTLPVLINPGEYYSGPKQGLPMLYAGDVITADKTIYIYYETGGLPSCPSSWSFTVKIIKQSDITPKDVEACDEYLLPVSPIGIRYFTLPGGPIGGGTELFGGISLINTVGITTIYTYFVSTETPSCILESKFDVTINKTPILTGFFSNVFNCTSYTLPPLAVGNYYTFNPTTGIYTPAVSPIITTTKIYAFAETKTCRTPNKIFAVYIGNVGLKDINQCQPYNLRPAPVGEFRDAPNGGGNIILPGLITQTTKIYTYVPSAGTPNCTDNAFFTITINAPFLTTPNNISACESFTLPTQVDGGEYYTLIGGPSTVGNIKLTPNVAIINSTTTIYIYKPSATIIGCFNEKPWLITINKKPIIDSRANVQQCDSYVLTPLTNGNYFDNPNGIDPLASGTLISTNNRIYIFAANPNDATCSSENYFDISIDGVKTDPIPAQLSYCDSFTFPSLPTANNFYYDAPGGPLGGGNKIPFGTTVTPATVLPAYYIYYETGDRLNCSDEKTFTITIATKPVANPVTTLETCDTFGDLYDGIFQFDLTALAIRNQVLNGQTPDSDFNLTFYTSLAEANDSNAIPISNSATYLNDTPFTDSVWIRVAGNLLPNLCFDVVELKLLVNPLPNPKLKPEYFICEDYETGTLLNSATLDTGLSVVNCDFEWTHDGNPYGGNTPSISTNQIGNYIVKTTNKTTLCENTATTKVTKYAPYLEITYSDAFENKTFITVNVLGVGSGNYEYKIDDFPFQDSNVFNNVWPGEHLISVNDKNGYCNPAPINAVIINYPKFFTPNGDGFNETWNIPHLALTNPNAPINIFDRYGKFIKQISPSTDGWNGMYNGNPLPATDYWFTVDYSEKGVAKIFKAHFSLKR